MEIKVILLLGISMYSNIIVEIIKNKWSLKKIAHELNITEELLIRKIIGEKEFRLKEVLKLISICGNLPYKYLFYMENNMKRA